MGTQRRGGGGGAEGAIVGLCPLRWGCCAPLGLGGWGTLIPGRCPGLACWAPLGLGGSGGGEAFWRMGLRGGGRCLELVR